MRDTHALTNNSFTIREQEMLILEGLMPAKAAFILPHLMDVLALVARIIMVSSSGCSSARYPALIPCLISGRGIVAVLSVDT